MVIWTNIYIGIIADYHIISCYQLYLYKYIKCISEKENNINLS